MGSSDYQDNRFKHCLGPKCSKSSFTHPALVFHKCKSCTQNLGFFSYYCGKQCQVEDWKLRERTFHRSMLLEYGKEGGYYRTNNDFPSMGFAVGKDSEWHFT
jgi:hypothetical protein